MRLLIGQIIGFIGTGVWILSYQFKKSRKLILCQMAGNILYITHFILIDALSGCMGISLNFIKNILLYNREKAWTDWWGWRPLLITASIASMFLTWRDWFSVLPTVAMITMLLASWSRNGRHIRLAGFFISSPSWLVYDFHAGSLSGVVCEIFALVSIALSFIRYGWKGLNGDGESSVS